MPFDPNTSKPFQDSMAQFDPSTAKEFNEVSTSPVPSEKPGLISTLANNPVTEGVLSFGGGAATALTNTAGTAIGKPNLSETIAPPDVALEAMEKYPKTAIAGKAAGYIGSAGATTALAGEALAAGGIGLIAQNAGLAGEALQLGAANAVAGSILSGPDNRILGAAIGGIATKASELISSPINYLTKASTIGTQLKQTVGFINDKIMGPPGKVAATSQANMWNTAQATEQQLANSFKSDVISTIPINVSNAAADVLASYNNPKNLGSLTNEQEGFLKQIISWSKPKQVPKEVSSIVDNIGAPLVSAESKIVPAQAFSFNELHTARKSLDQLISQSFNKVENGELSRGVADSLLSLRAPIVMDLEQAASKAGVLGQYKTFNKFYEDTVLPLMNTGAKDTADALTNIKDPLAAAKITDTLIDKYIVGKKPETAIAFLNTLDDSGRSAVEAQVVNNALKKAIKTTGTTDTLIFKKQISELTQSYAPIFSDRTKLLLNGLNNQIDQATTIAGMTIDLASLGAGFKLGAIGSVIGTAAVYGGGLATGIAAGAVLGLSKMVQSKVGQNLLIKAGSAGGQEVGKEILSGLIMKSAIDLWPKDEE